MQRFSVGFIRRCCVYAVILFWGVAASCVVRAADCTSGQQPYSVTDTGSGGPFVGTGSTPEAACAAVAVVKGNANQTTYTSSVSGATCLLDGGTWGSSPIVQVCTVPTTPPTTPTTTTTGSATAVICSGTCTVTIKHEFEAPLTAAPLTPAMVTDYMALFGLFLAAAVVVLCAKAIYNKFRIDYEG